MFQVRDHVRGKAGGAVMVVERAEGRSVGCLWFDQGVMHRRTFAAADLVLADARDAGRAAPALDAAIAR